MPDKVVQPMSKLSNRLQNLARNKNGEIVLGESPNIPIIVAVITSVVSFTVFISRPVGFLCLLIAFGAWFTWAWLEIFEGTTPLRRIIGGFVMVVLVAAGLTGLLVGVR